MYTHTCIESNEHVPFLADICLSILVKT